MNNILFGLLAFLSSCQTMSSPVTSENNSTDREIAASTVFKNAANSREIVFYGNSYVFGSDRYDIVDCTSSAVNCISSEGPISVATPQLCGNTPRGGFVSGTVRTTIFSNFLSPPTMMLRSASNPEVFFEYSFRSGITAIYDFRLDGGGTAEVRFSSYNYRYDKLSGDALLPCR